VDSYYAPFIVRPDRRASWGVDSPRHVRGYARIGRDFLYISQPGAPRGWLAWDGRAYVWIDEE